MEDDFLIQINGINKSFPGVKALSDVDFTLKRGEVHSLLGENGAGKSTLIKIISGAYSKDSGDIKFFGKSVNFSSPRDSIEKGVAVIYQELDLVPTLSVANNIFLNREPKKGFIFQNRTIIKNAQEILKKLDTNIDPLKKVKTLSVADQQMVTIAKALSQNVKILIMDEPTAVLGPEETKKLFNIVKQLKKQGIGIIFISHRLEEIYQIADRVTVLRDGEKVITTDVKNKNDPDIRQIIKWMVGRELTKQFPPKKNEIGETLLEVKNLTKKGVIEDVSFTLYKGEILGIAGLVGAGRTELARIIFGADAHDSGSIKFENKVINFRHPTKAIRSGFGFITEDRKNTGLFLILPVKNNITIANIESIIHSGIISLKQEKKKSLDLSESLNLKPLNVDITTRSLSGGNQQKVVVAKWLFTQAKLLIFDEPTRGIDVGAKYEIYKLMHELSSNGIGIIMISSELPEILGISDRVMVMRKGKIMKKLTTKNTDQEEILYYAAGGGEKSA
jgi:ribose transport system ATP-binding protein